jgi:large subunit ribosomal protein L10
VRREDKGVLVADLQQGVQEAAGMVLADFTGLDVPTTLELRRRCRGEEVTFRVVKNTLVRRAFSAAGLEDMEQFLTGPTALAYSVSDSLAAARVIRRFRDEFGRPTFKAGYIDGQVLSPEQVAVAATLPSRHDLLAKLLAALQSPARGLVYVLGEPMRGLVRILLGVSRHACNRGEEENQ